MKKVLFIEPVVAHYRRDTFNLILSNSNFSCAILAGSNYEGILPVIVDHSIISNYLKFSLLAHRFYFLKNALKLVKQYHPDAIVSSGIDFHHLHTILIYFWSKLNGIKFLWWSHATYGKQGRLGVFIRKQFYLYSDGILTYSFAGFNRLREIGIPAEKIKAIGNSMNMADYGINVEHSTNSQPTILYSGRITVEKKLDVLIKAIPFLIGKYKSLRCIVIGGGDLDYYIDLAKKLNVSQFIEFVGPLYGEGLKPYFSSADLFVYPSGIGLSIAHAFSYGLPVITTNNFAEHGPEIELLKPGINGDFFNDSNPESLANCIAQWFDKLNHNAEQIRTTCKNTLFEFGYLPEAVAGKAVSFISKVLLER